MKNVTIGNETYQGVNKVELNGTDRKPCIFTDTSGATATTGDMASGKTAYVDGALVTGDVPVSELQEIISANNAETTFSNNAIEMTYSTTEKKLHKQGFSISLKKPSSYFGNATSSDVLSGKTYTAAGGIAKVGTHVCQAPSGDDSSNATANPEDMASGKTAVVKGELITGNVETAESGNTKTLNRGTVRYSTGTGTVKVPVFIFKSGEFTKQLLFRNGSYAEFDTLASQFGDAEDENVVSGKTYTSKNGFAKTGTHVCAKPTGTIEITTNGIHDVSSYASANVNVPATGVDTSDATASPSDITIDKTAYVNGEKITGTLKTIESGETYSGRNGNIKYLSGVSGVSPFFQASGNTNYENVQLKNGSTINFNIDSSIFGDATAADVASGKTFTSKNGLKVAGTMSQQSSVQTKTGTFTLDADAESYDIVTGLTDIIAFEAHTTEPTSGKTVYKFSSVSNNNTAILKDASGQYLTYTYANSFSGWVTGGTIKAVKLTRTSYEYLLSHGTWNWTAIGN